MAQEELNETEKFKIINSNEFKQYFNKYGFEDIDELIKRNDYDEINERLAIYLEYRGKERKIKHMHEYVKPKVISINKDEQMEKDEALFTDYLETRYKKIIFVFACIVSFVVVVALTSPLENKELVMFLAMLMFAVTGTGFFVYTWVDFMEWKKDK